jgi:hypothetical protein
MSNNPTTETKESVLKRVYEDTFRSPMYEKSTCHHTYEKLIVEAMSEWERIVLRRKEEEEWISVKDRPPDTSREVLCSNEHGKQYVLWYNHLKESWCIGASFFEPMYRCTIIKWRELPSPPNK